MGCQTEKQAILLAIERRRQRPAPEPPRRRHCAHPPAGLGAWVGTQRHAWKAGQLAPARQQQLAALGLPMDAFEDAWAARFRRLAAFHSEHGHCRVPAPPAPLARSAGGLAGQARRLGAAPEEPQPQERYSGLYAWLQQQRHRWRQGTLPDERRRRLEGLGVEFVAPHESRWEQRFGELLAFKEVGTWACWLGACRCWRGATAAAASCGCRSCCQGRPGLPAGARPCQRAGALARQPRPGGVGGGAAAAVARHAGRAADARAAQPAAELRVSERLMGAQPRW